MATRKAIGPFLLVLIMSFAIEIHAKECKDIADWCVSVSASFCPDSQDMRTFCPAKCGNCPPSECDHCEHDCKKNGDDVYECTCLKGYRLQPDNRSCADINECKENPDICKEEEICKNEVPGHTCVGDFCRNFVKKRFIRSHSYPDQCCKETPGTCGGNSKNVPGRIIGGRNATRGMWPWQAYILLRRNLCGGTLLNKLWVVSAAHCFATITNLQTQKLEVRLGVLDTTDLTAKTITVRKVTQIIRHEKYDFPRNDIALLRMNRAVVYSDFLKPICLPNGEIPPVGTKCFVTGYGVTAVGGTASRFLRQVDVPIANGKICKKAYEGEHNVETDRMICAGYPEGGKDACQGDSGGPLVCQRCDKCDWYLAGVTSFGTGCAEAGFYGVYTKVEFFEEWIASKIKAISVKKDGCTPIQWTKWGDWSPCTESCDSGSQSRIRICQNGNVGDPGCVGEEVQTQSCNEQPCGEDSWTTWTKCSQTCGEGQQTRDRICVTPSCKVITRKRKCNRDPCPSWDLWSSWSECSNTCEGGERTRSRSCKNGVVGQKGCIGKVTDSGTCNEDVPCPAWTAWSQWTSCPVKCGGGEQISTRKCSDGIPGIDCVGRSRKTKKCNTNSCPGNFDPWTNWSKCTQSCGKGSQKRTRSCPIESCIDDGSEAITEQSRSCNDHDCVGEWSMWSPWDVCTKSCGSGKRRRIRSCIGGTSCPGKDTDTENCNIRECTGEWSDWSNWSDCSETCGDGIRERTRSCENGINCPGSSIDTKTCNLQSCPEWTSWGEWSSCDVTCEKGLRFRERMCGELGEYEGQCPGDKSESEECELDPCTVPANCNFLCTKYVSWGYCASLSGWMASICDDSCCSSAVCRNFAPECEVWGSAACRSENHAALCLDMCGYCPNS